MATSPSSASMSDAWRLLVDAPAGGAWNMAVDEVLLDGVAAAAAAPTLRFYGWSPACLSLGYFQPFDVVDLEGCRALGVDVVRRPTGGGALSPECVRPHTAPPAPPRRPAGARARVLRPPLGPRDPAPGAQAGGERPDAAWWGASSAWKHPDRAPHRQADGVSPAVRCGRFECR